MEGDRGAALLEQGAGRRCRPEWPSQVDGAGGDHVLDRQVDAAGAEMGAVQSWMTAYPAKLTARAT